MQNKLERESQNDGRPILDLLKSSQLSRKRKTTKVEQLNPCLTRDLYRRSLFIIDLLTLGHRDN